MKVDPDIKTEIDTAMTPFLRRLVKLPPPTKPKRLELCFVNYTEGDRLIREGWTIAPEEDNNHAFGMVYVERLEKPNYAAETQQEKSK